ncbi:MAG: LPS export ABC transporter periplasmic protein LptC [Candidatus Cloacimonadaceae bacterium]|nr:LPS export ABC transporter periplasmic protein LptC [Candidatus Cloacimonadaceae bacterium]
MRLLKLLSILLILVLAACQRTNLDVKTAVLDRALPDETSYNISIREYKGQYLDYIMQAAKVERFYDRKILNAYKVIINSYDEAGNISSTMLADTTIVDDARNIIFANGNVKLSSSNGIVSSNRLIWDRGADEITSPSSVTLVRDGNVLRGQSLRTNSSISYAEMDAVSAEGVVSETDIAW